MLVFEDYISVPENYSFTHSNGVYSVLHPSFRIRLDTFLEQYHKVQAAENYPFLPEQLLTNFPFVNYPPFKNEIMERQQDVKLLKKHLPLNNMQKATALELGGWNGWLPNFLSSYGIETISAGIFTDKNNGLGCRQFYDNCSWISLQTDLEETVIYKKPFDLIVFEHNLNFQHEPLALLKKYEALLKPNGCLVVLGAGVFTHTDRKAEEVKRYREYYAAKYNFKLDFYDSLGFFDYHFYETLLQCGYRFIPYYFTLKDWLHKKISSNKRGVFIYRKNT
jgi:SAM-dependent methyltransferase